MMDALKRKRKTRSTKDLMGTSAAKTASTCQTSLHHNPSHVLLLKIWMRVEHLGLFRVWG